MAKILIVVHLEPDFEITAGSLEELAEKVVEYSSEFDRIINITSAESLSGTEPFDIIRENFHDNREWIWGFDWEAYTAESPEDWEYGFNWIKTTGHEASEILDWMNNFSKCDEFVIVGGARNECLQDIADIWEHLGYKFEINESLTYG